MAAVSRFDSDCVASYNVCDFRSVTYQMIVRGKISSFGGPNDPGISQVENLGLYWERQQMEIMPELFLREKWSPAWGLAWILDPDSLYCAMRWNYNETPKAILRNSVVRIKSTHAVCYCRPVDWGPNENTGRVVDVSPRAMTVLGVKTDDVVECELLTATSLVVPEKLIVICIGHHPESPGARNASHNISEWDFNKPLAQMIADNVNRVKTIIMSRTTYHWTESEIRSRINSQGATAVIELHANAFDRQVSGTEMLYWHNSTRGSALAGRIQSEVLGALQLSNRGLKPQRIGDRGALFLAKTTPPAVICEPFFIDNDSDLRRAFDRRVALAKAYAAALDSLT